MIRRIPRDVAGSALVALALVVLLWLRVRDADGFYLDEWLYVGVAEELWEGFPGALWGDIPLYERGFQRLYPLLMAVPYGLFSTSTAYTLVHVLNVLLLASTVIPALLLVRRVVDDAWLRVLGVALAVVVPWTAIGLHMLTESLAYPGLMWTLLAIVRAAEAPTLARQLLALLAIGLLGTVRLNLLALAGVLVVASLAGEVARRDGWRVALRRQALILLVLGGSLAAVAIVLAAPEKLGHYGSINTDIVEAALFGDQWPLTRQSLLNYGRSLLLGGFVLPAVLGLAAALTGALGGLGPRHVVIGVAALANVAIVLVVVTIPTSAVALEERYVFYVYGPVALLAPVALEHLRRIVPGLLLAGALCCYVVAKGLPYPGLNSAHFFAWPAGASWTRAFEYRVFHFTDQVLGWLVTPSVWLFFAVLVAALAVAALVARRAPKPIRIGLVLVLVGCVGYQAAVMQYAMRKELFGPAEAPGGLANGPVRGGVERETFVDDALAGDERAALVPGVVTGLDPFGGAERMEFWNRSIDHVVALRLANAPVPANAGQLLIDVVAGEGGIAEASVPDPPRFVAIHDDDPRMQLAGEQRAKSPTTRFELIDTGGEGWRATWTASGLEPDTAVVQDRPVTFTLDRSAAPDVRSVEVDLAAVAAASPIRWRFTRGAREAAAGRLTPGATTVARLDVPACSGGCEPLTWTLTASGPAVDAPLPATSGPRPVSIFATAARLR